MDSVVVVYPCSMSTRIQVFWLFLSVMQDQRDDSFLEALRENYGKSPNESKLSLQTTSRNRFRLLC